MAYSITESEQIILEQLWEHGSMSVMQLVEALEYTIGWSNQVLFTGAEEVGGGHRILTECIVVEISGKNISFDTKSKHSCV